MNSTGGLRGRPKGTAKYQMMGCACNAASSAGQGVSYHTQAGQHQTSQACMGRDGTGVGRAATPWCATPATIPTNATKHRDPTVTNLTNQH